MDGQKSRSDGDRTRSVLTVVERKTGDAPRVSLREEDSVSAGSPLIDPQSQEKLSLTQGRGTYQLLGEIARGGMGVVMKGHDTDLGRDVAMKILNPDLAERAEVIQRFVEEAQIGGQLQHPGIVPVYELGLMEDERPYFTMKLVKGRTLAMLLAERKTPATNRRRFLDIFEAICQTMAYAHSRGVIHRDLKPANVMVGAFGEVQVVDWGLAKVLTRGGTADERKAREAHSIHTVLETVRSDDKGSGSDSIVGSVMGTPAYMSPEQAGGHVDRLDERSDVFSLGAILCEILTGAPPYTHADSILSDAARARLDAALARLDASGADPELVELTKDCLVATPGARPRNAGVLAERIHEHIASVQERAHQAQIEAAEARVKAAEERRARKLTAGLAAAVIMALAAGGGGWTWVQNERATRARELADRERAVAASVNAALAEASLLRGQAKWSQALAAVDRGHALALGGGGSSETLSGLDAVRAEIQHDAEVAELGTQRARANARLLEELRGVRASVIEGDAVLGANRADARAEDLHRLDQAYASLLLEHGIDIDAGTAEEAAAELRARGLGQDVALLLDDWMTARERTGDQSGAERLLDVAHLVDPDPVRADVREAVAAEDVEALLWLADSGLEDQPPTTLNLIGSALKRAGNWSRAVEVMEDAVRTYPDDALLQNELAGLLDFGPPDGEGPEERRARKLKALRHYWAALALQPKSVEVRHRLGILLQNDGDDLHAAAEVFRDGMVLDPGNGDLVYHLGAVMIDQERFEEAIVTLTRAVEMGGPSNAISHLGLALRASGREAEGLEQLLRAYERRDPPWNWASNHLLPALAESDVESVLAALRGPRLENTLLLNNLAWSLATDPRDGFRHPELAVELARRAVELDPDSDILWNTLGIARYVSGDWEGAVDDLERSMELRGDSDPYDWLFLAMAHHQLGNAEEALRWYERSVDWMERSQTTDANLTRFRAQADALLDG